MRRRKSSAWKMMEENFRMVNAIEVHRGEGFFLMRGDEEGEGNSHYFIHSFYLIWSSWGKEKQHTRTESEHIRDHPAHPKRQVELGTCH